MRAREDSEKELTGRSGPVGHALALCIGLGVVIVSACGDDHITEEDEVDGRDTSSASQIVARPEDRSGSGTPSTPSTPSNPSSSSGGGWGSGSEPTKGGETSGGNGEVYPPEEMHISMLRGCNEHGQWRTQFFLTGTPGRLSCLAVEDTDVIPSGAGFQYWVVLGDQVKGDGQPAQYGCPVGEYLIESSRWCQGIFNSDRPLQDSDYDNCGVYREWDKEGVFGSDKPVARSGLVQITHTQEEGCKISLELHFKDHASLMGTYFIEEVSDEASCSKSF